MSFLSIDDVEQYLSEIPKFQSDLTKATDFGLSRFRKFCEAIGNPQDDFSSVHVAGTNGKGSTCSILEAVYREGGVSVGKYTSPHIFRFNERFIVDGQPIPDEELLQFFREFHDKVEEYRLTYFEISTAIAFWWFAKLQVDLGIIEVGLGGRLDATNIIDPLVSVITSISLDHTDILGGSLEKVAREKGGIIKAGRPVVVGQLAQEAEGAIRKVVENKDADIFSITDLKPEYMTGGKVKITVNEGEITFSTALKAPVQAFNVAVAWQVTRVLNDQLSVTQQQFGQALKQLNVGYGRFEKLSETKQWYFDGAHNIEAVQKLRESVSSVGEIGSAVLILSLMRDKITPKVMEEFSEFKNIYYYSLNTERAASVEDIKRWLPQMMAFPTRLNQQRQLLEEFDSELVIFAGSFYFYATVRDWIKNFA
ncbi:bifunctional folylpolyglutamate synthase/dihydrofolate synthase [Fodinibius salsisoli]|uniref:Dihydrofolate synthase/folylpolyglutamate synthase n=1 Tax=Fodinibius salsisoli TaxID=2820877 RepID=A0ABT3PJ39_9BACT|nr:folylpolyglutamate synthase/dihydrofolate synthase family protein [Fodinibius salsisoli]MCW9705941.1 bifunctional folylpolyglutamate synthase/dihydrofolate synthase [Fodinibius salsisoli]